MPQFKKLYDDIRHQQRKYGYHKVDCERVDSNLRARQGKFAGAREALRREEAVGMSLAMASRRKSR